MKGVSYKIIGGDGREYGPITLNDVRDWIDDERVALGTRVWSSEDALWLPAVERPELKWNFEAQLILQPPVPPALPSPGTPAAVQLEQDRVEATRAPLIMRLAAIIYDYLIFSMTLGLLTSPWSVQIKELNDSAFKNLGSAAPDPKLVWDMLRYLGTAVLPASYFYYAAVPALFGCTPGKFIARLEIVSTDGVRLSWGRATVRWIGSIACAFTFGFGFLPLFFTPRRQGLHDLLAGTCVVRRVR